MGIDTGRCVDVPSACEPVAVTVAGNDELGVLGVVFDFLAQPGDVDVYRAGQRYGPFRPRGELFGFCYEN
jgi:hypothetical protein